MFDQGLAEEIRIKLSKLGPFIEMPMFGGLAFMVNNHMCCGALKNELILRAGKENADEFIRLKIGKYFTFTGTPMKTIVVVKHAVYSNPKKMNNLIKKCFEFVLTLPPKKPKKRSARPVRR